MELEYISVEQINIMSLKYQNKALIGRLESLKRELDVEIQIRKQSEQQKEQIKKRELQFVEIWRNQLRNLEQSYQINKKGNESRLILKFSQCYKYIDSFMQQDEKEIQENGQLFIKNIQNIFVESFIELRRSWEENQNYINQIMQKESINDRIRLIYEQSKNTDKKYKDLEIKYQQINQQLLQLQKEQDSNQQIISEYQQQQQQLKQLKNINLLYQKRLCIKIDYDVQRANSSLLQKYDQVCICKGNIKQMDDLNEEQNNQQKSQITEEQKQNQQKELEQKYEQEQEKLEQTQIKVINDSEELCYEDKYKALLDEYNLKCSENKQLQMDLNNYENNLENMFYQSQIFNIFVDQTQKISDQNQKYKNMIKQLEIQIKQIEQSRQKEIEELEKISNFNLSKSQNELRQLKLEKSNQVIDSFDVYSHVKPLVEGLELSNKNIEEIKKDRDFLFNENKQYSNELTQLKEYVFQLKKKMNDLECQILINKEINNVNYDQLSYKGGRYKEIINECHKIIMKNYGHMKTKFDELIIYLKTREQKIDYLEQKNKQLQKEVRNQQKQQEDLIVEIDLTSQNYNEIIIKNKKMVQQIKDQEETFDKLAKDKFREKQKLEGDKNTLLSKVKVDQELIQSQNGLIFDLECQVQLLQQAKQKQDELNKSLMEQLEDIDNQNTQLQQINQDLIVQKNQLSNKSDNLQIQFNELQDHCNQVSLCLQEAKKFIDRKISNRQNSANDEQDDATYLQQLEYQQLKQKIMCSVCQRNHKKVILQKCSHMFCKDCLDKTLAVRNRACPICKNKFGQEDIKEIYFT